MLLNHEIYIEDIVPFIDPGMFEIIKRKKQEPLIYNIDA
jgi:hypothetical protein